MLSPFRTFALTAVVSIAAHAQRHDWPVHLGDKATTHYSTLDQINKQKRLAPARGLEL
jgi:hypothetical protein